ncbi:hypothetical protein MMC31_006875, partial [Peltigera leucophlebia]|nr:hypothetical protein [Peltigera leucophlebia]
AQKEGRRSVAKLEEEVLNGRKLIEDLQTDKRRDRQMLFEFRAQLVRPTHAAPPSHINPLRFGGSGPQFMGPPAIPGPSAFPYAGPPAFPITNFSSSAIAPPAETPLTSPRPIIRLPFRPPPTPVPLPASASPPPNAPKGPKSGPSGPSRGPERSQ